MGDIRYEGGMPFPPPAVGEVRIVRTERDAGYWLEIGKTPRKGSTEPRTKRLWIAEGGVMAGAKKVFAMKLPGSSQAISSLNGQQTKAAPKAAGTGGKA